MRFLTWPSWNTVSHVAYLTFLAWIRTLRQRLCLWVCEHFTYATENKFTGTKLTQQNKISCHEWCNYYQWFHDFSIEIHPLNKKMQSIRCRLNLFLFKYRFNLLSLSHQRWIPYRFRNNKALRKTHTWISYFCQPQNGDDDDSPRRCFVQIQS